MPLPKHLSPKNRPVSKFFNKVSLQLRYNHGIRSYLGYIGILAGLAMLIFQLKSIGDVGRKGSGIGRWRSTSGENTRSYSTSNNPDLSLSSLFDDRNSYRQSTDPKLDTVDCFVLMFLYRKNEIQRMEQDPYRKSSVKMTKTNPGFYISTHDEKVDSRGESLFSNGDYFETAMTAAFETILNPFGGIVKSGNKRKIVVDVGGHIGWFSLLSASNHAEVYTFEPNIVNMVRFCESLVLNHWAITSYEGNNRVHPYMKGVSNVHGGVHKMYKIEPDNPASYSFDGRESGGKNSLEGGALPLVTLDALARDQGWLGNDGPSIAILKIDVEGLEFLVLQGAHELLGTKRVENIFMEFHSAQSQADLSKTISFLHGLGYRVYKIGAEKGPDTMKSYDSVLPLIEDIRGKVYGDGNVNIWFQMKT